MSHDNPNLTAYVLGEGAEDFLLDPAALEIANQTALVARILSRQLRKPRRRPRFISQAIAAALLVCLISSPARWQATVPQASQSQVVQVKPADAPILHLTVAFAESPKSSLLADTTLTGIRSVDVEQLVSAVLEDASRVGSFSSFRLSADPVSFQ